jgi:hypothetical protein
MPATNDLIVTKSEFAPSGPKCWRCRRMCSNVCRIRRRTTWLGSITRGARRADEDRRRKELVGFGWYWMNEFIEAVALLNNFDIPQKTLISYS